MSLRPHRHAGCATRHSAAVFETYKDPVPCRIKGTVSLPWTKIPKVGVALALICVVTLGPIAEMHCPVTGSV